MSSLFGNPLGSPTHGSRKGTTCKRVTRERARPEAGRPARERDPCPSREDREDHRRQRVGDSRLPKAHEARRPNAMGPNTSVRGRKVHGSNLTGPNTSVQGRKVRGSNLTSPNTSVQGRKVRSPFGRSVGSSWAAVQDRPCAPRTDTACCLVQCAQGDSAPGAQGDGLPGIGHRPSPPPGGP